MDGYRYWWLQSPSRVLTIRSWCAPGMWRTSASVSVLAIYTTATVSTRSSPTIPSVVGLPSTGRFTTVGKFPVTRRPLSRRRRRFVRLVEGRRSMNLKWLKKSKKRHLVYAATSRCKCGLGLAYEPGGRSGMPIHGYWDCSGILLGTADPSVQHSDIYPFTFYEIKSERQPSAEGLTTRPEEEK